MARMLEERVAVVTGASRGVGKGIALALGDAGATVYVTGRTERPGQAVGGLGGTIHDTARLVTERGGVGIAVRCDHRDDEQTRALFACVAGEQGGRLDLLVNNVWGGYEHFYDGTEFWKEEHFWDAPLSRWDAMFGAGVRAHYAASALAIPLMLPRRRGLIVNVSFHEAQNDRAALPYGLAKAADDRMALLMANAVREFGIAVVALYPGLVRTESVLAAGDHFDLSNAESPEFTGRAVAHLAADPSVMERSGRVLVAAMLAQEYGFTDVDGEQPRPIFP